MADEFNTLEEGALEVSVWSPSEPDALESLRGILRLAKRYSGTLGFLPNRAFADRARKQGLIFARRNCQVIGYVLFDLPRAGQIKLVHVCVAQEARGNMIAKRMTDLAIENNPFATGIYAACREDYGIDAFWVALGMAPRGNIPGRALKGSVLVQWWRPLGQLDLFESLILNSDVPLAVLDSNVVADLFGSSKVERPTRSESEGLNANWLADAVKFAVSSQVDVENQRNQDRADRAARTKGSASLPRLRSRRPDDTSVEDQMLRFIGPVELTKDASLHEDVKHLADAINSGARYFVTHDRALISVIGKWAEVSHGIRVLRPSELIVEVAVVPASRRFQSRIIESVSYSWNVVAGFDISSLAEEFLSSDRGEKVRSLERLMRELGSRTGEVDFEILTGPNQELVAAVAMERGEDCLQVPLYRVREGRAGGTVAFQLARWLRMQAVRFEMSKIQVLDSGTDSGSRAALLMDGFGVEHEVLEASPIVGTLSVADLALEGDDLVAQALSLERAHWPLVVADLDLPTYLVPIQPRFAEALFGYQQDALFQIRKRSLGLSREHVYYHAEGAAHIPAGPARVLWYATHDRTSTVRRVVAVSRTIETRSLEVAAAHQAYSHLGTLKLRDVAGAANKRGVVHVIRFEDSQLLSAPLARSSLRELLQAHGVREPIQSLRRVPTALFVDVVKASGIGGTW